MLLIFNIYLFISCKALHTDGSLRAFKTQDSVCLLWGLHVLLSTQFGQHVEVVNYRLMVTKDYLFFPFDFVDFFNFLTSDQLRNGRGSLIPLSRRTPENTVTRLVCSTVFNYITCYLY